MSTDRPIKTIEGQLSGTGRYAIVASRFNEAIVGRLLGGALEALNEHGIGEQRITVVWVPGAFELPQIARRLAASYDAIVALGCVIRGETAHFDYVAGQCAAGLAEVALAGPACVTLGVLTTDTADQALARAGSKADNKGYEAALAAIRLVDLSRRLEP